ncbi:uncharacterized protein [Henckelia pumila]|uniref:uncharacterized protein n=1 Tax=Henckelia pumila TaxID=405737 RepID=UPI003C6DC118
MSRGKSSGQGKRGDFKGGRIAESRTKAPISSKPQEKPVCYNCGIPHFGECMLGTEKCYLCKRTWHMARNCPGVSESSTRNVQGRVFAMTKEKVDPNSSMTIGMFMISGLTDIALVDSGATHCFLSESFVRKLGITPDRTKVQYEIALPSGQEIQTNQIVRTFPIQVQSRELYADFVVLTMTNFDVILGMDWLSKYQATIDYERKIVNFAPILTKPFTVESAGKSLSLPVISVMKARKMIHKGCQGFLVVVTIDDHPMLMLEDTKIFCDFPVVFPDDIASLLPNREIEFVVDIVPGTNPIFKSPYRMAPTEIKELKDQSQELLDKWFIRSSFSP